MATEEIKYEPKDYKSDQYVRGGHLRYRLLFSPSLLYE